MNQQFIKKYRLLFLFAGTLIMMVLMAKSGTTLKTPSTSKGIIDLEFAYNESKAAFVINAWTGIIPADNRFIAIINTSLDFIFLIFYSLFLYFACKMIAAKGNGLFFTIGNFLAKGALAAGALDILENIGMLITLNGHLSDTNTLLTFIFSISKWILVLAAVLYTLIAGARMLYKKLIRNG